MGTGFLGAGGGAAVASAAKNAVLAKGSVSSVSASTQTTIASLAANGVRYITKIVGSGEDYGQWEIFINSVSRITHIPGNYTMDLVFSTPLKVDSGTPLDVKVTHFTTGANIDFEASIIGYGI